HRHPASKQKIPIPRSVATPAGRLLETSAQRESDRVALERYAPAGVLINADGQVLQFRGDTSPYLKPPTGRASFSVLKMAREGLLLPLRAALRQSKNTNRVVRRENVCVNQNGRTRIAHLEILPLKNLQDRCYLIFFRETSHLGRPPFGPGEGEAARGARERGGLTPSKAAKGT